MLQNIEIGPYINMGQKVSLNESGQSFRQTSHPEKEL